MSRRVVWARFESEAPMGQQRHESELQRALRRAAGPEWDFALCSVAPLRHRRDGAVRLPLRAVSAAPYAGAAAAARLAYGRADLVHRFDLRLPPSPGLEVVTVHDLPPLRFRDEGSLPRWAASSARRAVGVVCPSQFAAGEARTLLGVTRAWVVPNGVSEVFVPAGPRDDLGLAARLVAHAGGATERKNLPALAAAWRRVAEAVGDASLVLCGPPDPRRERLLAGLPRAVYVGHLAPACVAALMRAAAAVVVPSLYEGFGLPALEGLAVGVPVVAAARGALPEVCGDAALLVEPTPDGLADGLLAVLEDELLAGELRRRGPERAAPFTWERAARETLAVYEEALG